MDGLIFIVIIGTAIWVLADAKTIGVRKGLISGMGNMDPWAWFFGTLLLWIVVFPFYLAKRGAFKAAIAAAKGQPVAAANPNALDQLEKLSQLKEKGVITQDEFDKKKKELLG